MIETTGEDLSRVLGMAFDRDGRLYVADPGRKALMRVGTDGAVVLVAEGDGDEPFESPNDVTVGPDGAVYLSDTCTGKFYALTADGVVTDRVELDPAVDGGPNGVVVGPDGALWVTTENTALFCADEVGIVDSLGGLYRIPVDEGGMFGPIETVARGVGVFGDGLVFDRVGNLYVIFDTVKDFALDETVVFARPREGGELRRVLSARGKVWANLAFPPKDSGADYGLTTLYLSRLAVPPFVPIETRGLDRVELGIGGE
jgi:sugar lactone lactonase YvrE